MKVASKFTVAVHTLLFIYNFDGKIKTSSENIASSVGVNPVIIRQVLSDLKNAGIITVKFGTGGASLSKSPSQITLFDIYQAVIDSDDTLFSFHKNPELNCPVGKNIHSVLDSKLEYVEEGFNNRLKSIKLSELTSELDKLTK